jgi:serine phosphatase RsbU (regulator of sigma subunit)/CHASE1-domain containing sensor protein
MAGRERETRRDGLVVALAAVLVALLVIGAVAVVLAAVREREDADEREREATELVKADVGATVNEVLASMTGSATIVADDEWEVDLDRWELFAMDATAGSSADNQLSLVAVVTDDRRAEFEAAYGTILELSPDGELVRAADRPGYLPVRDVASEGAVSRRPIGFDIASEPSRAEAAVRARDSGTTQVSAPIVSLVTGTPTLLVVKPLYRLGATIDTEDQRKAASVGFVTTGVRGDALIDAALPRVPVGTRFSITDGETLIGSTSPGPGDAQATSLDAAGSTWTLTVDDGYEADYSLAWLIGVVTLLIAGALAVVAWTRIHAQRQHAADERRHARSADLAQRLAQARTTAAVAEVVHDEVPPLLDAFTASVRIMDPTNQVLQAVIDEHLPVPLAERGDVPVNRNSPPGRAVLDGDWLLLSDVAHQMADYPAEVTELLATNEFRALASVPLKDESGTVVGLLGVAWDEPREFDATTLALLRTVAELCEQTLERSRLHDSEHLLVQRLQLSALSPPPTVDKLDLAVRYESAVQTMSMGGDWYDTVVLDEHTLALVVGDVAGHGVPAIAEMIELRSSIHALLRAHHPLDQVFDVADGILTSGERTRIATALIAVFDSREQCVRYVSAGHPPAVLRSPNGDVEVMMDGRRPVLGVPPVSPCVMARRPFVDGSTFVAYTDGLVERRDEDILLSVDRLAEDLATSVLRGDELADAILVAHAPTHVGDDDIALVIVHAT